MSLQVNNLNYAVPGKMLLKNMSVAVNQAKVIGIIGPNGAGKSTLLKCLTALLPSPGCIQLNGQPLAAFSPLALAKIRAALPQESPLNFPFPAAAVVGMSFALSRISLAQQEQLIDACLSMVAAQHLALRNFLSLSGGEKQRVHIARVLAQLLQHEPSEAMRFLCLDEPTAPLDLKHQHQLFSQLQQLTTQNISSLVVIHDINLAASYCDEIWVINHGRLVCQDVPQRAISQRLMKTVFEVDIEVSLSGQQQRPIIHKPINQPISTQP
ncbi:heme ABC transporter ATP-binding protein [Marinicella meishanensis]|uniref:heme ABC transporter ATP-binding protein n=1 Tax=Marinicella meishanensis TaxID=2873263 RepID=UPI001CBBE712|nr:heme ABC transporter ATP-binding protein [Marinicella sp. NBU2979]